MECGMVMYFKQRNTSSDVCVSSDRPFLKILQFMDNLFKYLLLGFH